MCIVCITNNINRNVYMYLNTRIFPTTGYARVLLFMFIRQELEGTGTVCLFQFTYCDMSPTLFEIAISNFGCGCILILMIILGRCDLDL